MLKLTFKVSMLLASAFSAILQAQEQQTDELKAEKQSPVTIISSQTCPQDFYSLSLFPNAKFCQLFSEELPASLSYFAMSDQQTVKEFYLKQLGHAEKESKLKGRIVLQYAKGQKIIVISKDDQGSQIDILVKPQS